MPIDSSCTPLKNIRLVTRVAQPGTSWPSMKCSMTIHRPNPIAPSAISAPTPLHSRSGTLVKAVMPVKARRVRLFIEKLLCPDSRSAGR